MAQKTLDCEAQQCKQLLTRAIDTLGEDVVLDAFRRAVGQSATPIDPSSSPFEAWLADNIQPRAVQTMMRVNLPTAMDALTSELLRLLTRH
jgi:hypothetical protein